MSVNIYQPTINTRGLPTSSLFFRCSINNFYGYSGLFYKFFYKLRSASSWSQTGGVWVSSSTIGTIYNQSITLITGQEYEVYATAYYTYPIYLSTSATKYFTCGLYLSTYPAEDSITTTSMNLYSWVEALYYSDDTDNGLKFYWKGTGGGINSYTGDNVAWYELANGYEHSITVNSGREYEIYGRLYHGSTLYRESNHVYYFSLPEVHTVSISSITNISAISGGSYIAYDSTFIQEIGVCVKSGSTPYITDPTYTPISITTPFTSNITGLTPGTEYHCRAYAYMKDNSTGAETINYGEEVIFTTLSTYTATFNSNGGSGFMSPQSASNPTNLTANSFTRTNYTFAYWNTSADSTGTQYNDSASYSFSANITLYAQWRTAAPSNFIVSSINDGSGVNMSWDKVIGTYSYWIYRSDDGGYVYNYLNSILDTGASTYSFSDYYADPPHISAPTISASQGIYEDYVLLSLDSGGIVSDGTTHYYYVIARTSVGVGSTGSEADFGHRNGQILTYQWKRADTGSGIYSDILAATSVPYNDGTAPRDGIHKYYKLQLTSSYVVESPLLSIYAEGWRKLIALGITTDAPSSVYYSSAILNSEVTGLYSYNNADVYFEWGLNTSYGSYNASQNVTNICTIHHHITTGALEVNKLYHYRAVIIGYPGIVRINGADRTFHTTVNTPGIAWIEAGDIEDTTDFFCYLDANTEKRKQACYLDTEHIDIGTPGYLWVEDEYLCMVDASGNICAFSGSDYGFIGIEYAGYIWIDNANFMYIDELGYMRGFTGEAAYL